MDDTVGLDIHPDTGLPLVDFAALIPAALIDLGINVDRAFLDEMVRRLQAPGDELIEPVGLEAVHIEEATHTLRGLLDDLANLNFVSADAATHGLLLAASWWMVTCRQARLVLAAFDIGLPDAAIVNVRLAFEHAVVLAVLARQPDEQRLDELMEAIEGASAVRFRQLLAALTALDPAPDELIEFARATPQVELGLTRFAGQVGCVDHAACAAFSWQMVSS